MKISIITVAFNSAKTIRDTIDSVASQNHRDLEYLVIDGGSTDGTLDIIKCYQKLNINLISESDKGIYDAMNKGIRLATGNVIGFINSDDFYADSNVLSKITSVFQDPSVDCCYGDLCYVDQFDSKKISRYWQSCPFVPKSFCRGWCPPHPTFFARRSVYKKFGGFDLNFKLAADFELMARFLEKFQVNSIYIPNVLVHMRLGGVTNKNFKNVIVQNNEIVQALKKLELDPSFFRLFFNKFLSKLSQYFRSPAK